MGIDVEIADGVAVITIDRPEVLNALSFALIKDFGDALDGIEATEGVRAVIVTGAGQRAFCAGADIAELQDRSLFSQREGAVLGQRVFAKLGQMRVPTIALLNGYAFGGGLELALACSFRIAMPNTKVGLPEIKLGLIPGYGGTQRLPRLIGESRALELILTGRTVDAQEALAIGLVNRLVEGDGLTAAKEYAAAFTKHGLVALQMARLAVTRALDLPLHEGLQVEADLSTLAYQTADAREGMSAFLAKRPAQFTDR